MKSLMYTIRKNILRSELKMNSHFSSQVELTGRVSRRLVCIKLRMLAPDLLSYCSVKNGLLSFSESLERSSTLF